MKKQALLLSLFGFGATAMATIPDGAGMEPLKITCGSWLRDKKCAWDATMEQHLWADHEEEFVQCIMSCRHEHGLRRLIYHQGRYFDISLEEYDGMLKAGTSASVSAAVVTVTETAAAAAAAPTRTLIWDGPHSSALPGSSDFKTVIRTVTKSAAQASGAADVSVLETRDIESGDGDNHHCNNPGVRRWCHFKASMHIFSVEKHYNRCIQKCVRKHNGDNYGFPEQECVDEGYGEEVDALLEKRDDLEDHPCNKTSKKVGCRTECM
jgi:hypothetical protein